MMREVVAPLRMIFLIMHTSINRLEKQMMLMKKIPNAKGFFEQVRLKRRGKNSHCSQCRWSNQSKVHTFMVGGLELTLRPQIPHLKMSCLRRSLPPEEDQTRTGHLWAACS
jgi:hypothetical protein